MSQTLTWFDPGRAVSERPACPNCHGRVMFTGTASGPAGLDLGIFECVMCNYAEEVAIPTSMMGWINSSELRPPN